MPARRKICVVTGSRAEYGLLRWLMKEIVADSALQLQLVVTGSHLSPRFGLTVREIEADGFTVDQRVDLQLDGDSSTDIARAMGKAITGMGETFEQIQPDILVVLGDRYEILAAAQAALIARIPIAHIHGGESTEGALDDAMRHAITKLAVLHFASAEPYARRIIQMGEEPTRVHNVGALGVDAALRVTPLEQSAIEAFLALPLGAPTLLVTYHPTTLGLNAPIDEVRELVAAIETVPTATVVITGVNADSGYRDIDRELRHLATLRPKTIRYTESLGQRRYLSLMRLSSVVLGNSSSAMFEAPALGIPAVNVGDRQKGRLRAASIIDCPPERGAIRAALTTALSAVFRKSFESMPLPYGDGKTAGRIKAILKSVDLSELARKRFHDLAFA